MREWLVKLVNVRKTQQQSATQTAVAMALYYKAFEVTEEERAIAQLLELIEAKSGCLITSGGYFCLVLQVYRWNTDKPRNKRP